LVVHKIALGAESRLRQWAFYSGWLRIPYAQQAESPFITLESRVQAARELTICHAGQLDPEVFEIFFQIVIGLKRVRQRPTNRTNTAPRR
jgi:hypothetical protein